MEFQRCFGWIMLVIAFSTGVRQRDEPGPKAEATQTDPKKNSDPIAVSAQALAQAVQDDVNAAARKYHLRELQVDGVVSGQSEYKGKVALIKFDVMVKDRKADKVVGFTVFCSLKDRLAKGDKGRDAIAVGKNVTVRGKSTAMGNGQVTLTGCTVVRKRDEAKPK